MESNFSDGTALLWHLIGLEQKLTAALGVQSRYEREENQLPSEAVLDKIGSTVDSVRSLLWIYQNQSAGRQTDEGLLSSIDTVINSATSLTNRESEKANS